MVSNSMRENVVFTIGDRTIFLDKALVDKYSEVVCPVDEKFVEDMVCIFDEKQDDVASFMIAFDMAREVHEYGY